MALQKGNILILESDTMNDTDAGGGNITNTSIIGGESNNFFNDISPLARTTGALNVRKVFPAVSIRSTDVFYGAHTIISKIPKDEQVNVTLFNGNDWHDRRDSAIDRIAGHFGKGIDYPGFLYGTAYAGSKTFNIFQSVDVDVPIIGEVLILSSGEEEQYVRISQIESFIRTFTVGDTTFTRKIVTITISDNLNMDFIGSAISDQDDIVVTTTINKTIVSDSAKYYSTRPLDRAIVAGDVEIKADDLFTQLVPNTLIESAFTDLNPALTTTTVYPVDNPVSFNTSTSMVPGTLFGVGQAIASGTLVIETGSGDITDEGGSILFNGVAIGSVNYTTGVITFGPESQNFSGTKGVSYNPAVAIRLAAYTDSTEINIANRGEVFTYATFQPIGKGSARVFFRSIDSWYTLFDDGGGNLFAENTANGVGTIDYDTGTFSINLGELPDIGSHIIWAWGNAPAVEVVSSQPLAYDQPTDYGTAVPGLAVNIPIPEENVDLSSIAITWSFLGSKAATVSTTGTVSGDASGRVYKTTTGWMLSLIPLVLPSLGTNFTVNYDTGTATEVEVTINQVNPLPVVTYQLPDFPIEPGTATAYFQSNTFDHMDAFTQQHATGTLIGTTYYDDGLGGFKDNYDNTIPNCTIDYATGEVNLEIKHALRVLNYTVDNSQLVPTYTDIITLPKNGTVRIRANTTTPESVGSVIHSVGQMKFFANGDARAMDILEDSLTFNIGSDRYLADGYSVTLDSTVVGSINRLNGEVSLTSWSAGSGNQTINVVTLLEVVETAVPLTISEDASDFATGRSVFRVDASSIKSQSFQMEVPYTIVTTGTTSTRTYNISTFGELNQQVVIIPTTYTTGFMTVRSDVDGNLLGTFDPSDTVNTGVDVNVGSINYETSTIIFEPAGITFDPSKAVYSATSRRFIPIDSDILGIDHVRLPENGRVPCFAVGDVVVIHNTTDIDLTPTTGDTTQLAETNLAKVEAVDSSGATLLSTQYVVDLVNGVVSWTNLTGVILPITVSYTIEDLSVLSDVQIDGTLGLTIGTTHDYPVQDTLVSNALLHGDMFANVSNPFDQQTWTGEWSNEQIGSATLGEFNNTLYPIAVTNTDCIEEEWLLQFVSSALINVIGRNTGQILTGVGISNTEGSIAPINPATGFPYFTISNKAFGGGWSSGNAIRFNTHSANAPIWVIQSVNQGAATNTDEDSLGFCIDLRGARNSI